MFSDLLDPHQDPLVRGRDRRIRIRILIRTKMSWIRKTAFFASELKPWETLLSIKL
jgi:hypothetical protein